MTPTQLARFMKQRRWSVSELAARIPVSPRSVRFWLAGDRTISDAIAERIKSLLPEAKPIKSRLVK